MSARNRKRHVQTSPWDDAEVVAYEVPANEFYRTPAWVLDPVVSTLRLYADSGWTIIDAGAGDGAISQALVERGVALRRLLAVEADHVLAARCRESGIPTFQGDFLSDRLPVKAKVVVMNPPYSRAMEFVRRAIDMVGDGLVMALLRVGFAESHSRAEFHKENPSHMTVLAKRPPFVGGKTDATAYAWFVWGTGMEGRWDVDPCEGAPRRGRRR